MPTPLITLAIVEDEPILREGMAFQLRHQGFTVCAFENAPQFYRHLAVQHVDIAVLDIGLAGEDGLSICEHLRQHARQMGIIFVTARAMRDDRLAGLGAGADAYFVKPVDMKELALVLHQLGQRLSGALEKKKDKGIRGNEAEQAASALTATAWRLTRSDWQLFSPEGQALALSSREHQLLSLLFKADHQVVSKAALVKQIFGSHSPTGGARLEVLLSRLRKRCSTALGQSLPVKTAHAEGYSFGAPSLMV